MQQRESSFLLIGLAFGLIGGLLLAATTGLNTRLFSASARDTTPAVPGVYYQVELDVVKDWLLEHTIQEVTPTPALLEDLDDVEQAYATIAALPSASNFSRALRGAEPEIDLFLTRTYVALAGTDLPEAAVDTEPLILACLGLYDNPYLVSGPALYVYLRLPPEQTTLLPDTWFPLDEPKTTDLYWQLLACRPEESAA